MSEQSEDKRLSERLLRIQAAGAVPMTVEEILAGKTQAGVPRPSFLAEHEDDGTVEAVSPKPG